MATSGRPTWYKPDVGLSMRMVFTMFLLGLVYVVFGFILYRVGMPLAFLIIIAGAIAFAQFFFADKIALFAMRAREVSEAEAPQLHEMIGRLALQANLPKPKVAIVDTSLPNAFATGRSKNHAVVAVTTGILSKLPAQELEAVLAHELTHIINRDMLVMTIATFFSMVAGLLTRTFLWTGGGYGYGRRSNNNDGGGAIMIALLASVVVYAVSFVLIRTLSRYRELAADRGSALMTGAPMNLASALLRISDRNQRIPQQQDAREAAAFAPVSALCFVPPQALRADDVMTIFSTHPSTEERVARLQEMQAQMEHSQRF